MHLDEKALESAKRGYEMGMAHSHDDCLRAAITAYLKNLPAEPVAWADVVGGSLFALSPNKSKQCSQPLFLGPNVPVTDEAVERAAKAIQATKINGQRVRFSDAYAAMMARAALETASREGRG